MAKLFESEYPDNLIRQIEEYITEKCYEGDNLKVFNPSATLTLYDQDGKEIL